MGQSRAFRLQSAGSAYNLIVGFVPTRVEILNLTKWATDGSSVKFYWDESMADGYAYAEKCEDSSSDKAIITSNGVTPYEASNFASNQYTITGISKASNAVVTCTNTASVGDFVHISGVVGMEEINDASYKVLAASASSITIEVNSTNFGTYTSGGIAANESATTVDNGGQGVTLGTSVIGSDNDILVVYCYLDDMEIEDLGDIA